MAQKTPLLYENVFSKSPEKIVGAQKKPTRVIIHLEYPGTLSEIPAGTTFYVGEQIKIRGILEWQDATGVWRAVAGTKPLKFYHRVNTGAWELIATKNQIFTPGVSLTYADVDPYTLAVAGNHSFYVEFEGDAEYVGCGKEAKSFARKCSVC